MSVTRFAISAEPSRLHRCYLLAAATALWLPASLLLSADRLIWFAPGWLLVSILLWVRSGGYRLEGEYNNGVLSLNGRSGVLSRYSRAGPGFLLLVLKDDSWPPLWLFQDAVPETVFRRLSQKVLLAS
ncbi:MAG: protein YgfX [Oceanisphaera sp.]|nr:protein YgfX [Oceanisphaera sp.]